MNCLLVNPKHPQTFWSFERVLRMLGKEALQPPLGMLTLAALLPKTWNLRMVDLNVRALTQEDWDFCQVLMVGGLVSQTSGMMEMIQEGRSRSKTVVAGGPTAYHISEDLLEQGCHLVVKGEAEGVIPRLVEALESGEQGVVLQAAERPELSDSPIPRYDLIDLGNYQDMAVQFSRGCPFGCEFCDITFMLGRKVRTKQPGQVLDELQQLYDLGWRGAVFFVDDNFIGNPSAALDLLERLAPWAKERGYPFEFYTQASVDLAKHADLLELMAASGFYRVFLGIETQDVESLKLSGKLQNARVDLNEVCRTITAAGLQIIAGCIIGFDNEKPGADQRLIDFAVRNNIPEMFITPLQAGPGTAMWDRLESEGRLFPLVMDDDLGSQTALLNFTPTRPMEQIAAEYIHAYRELYDPAAFLQRCVNQFAAMKVDPPPKKFGMLSWAETRALALTFFWMGLVHPKQTKFWQMLWATQRRAPARLRHFIAACVTSRHYEEYRNTIEQRIGEALERYHNSEQAPPPPPQ